MFTTITSLLLYYLLSHVIILSFIFIGASMCLRKLRKNMPFVALFTNLHSTEQHFTFQLSLLFIEVSMCLQKQRQSMIFVPSFINLHSSYQHFTFLLSLVSIIRQSTSHVHTQTP